MRRSHLNRALVLDWHQRSKFSVFIGFDARFFTCMGVPFTFFPVALDVCFSLRLQRLRFLTFGLFLWRGFFSLVGFLASTRFFGVVVQVL